MSRPVSINTAQTASIASYVSANTYMSTSTTQNPPSNGVNSSANTSVYASFSATSTSNNGYAYYRFGSLDIPVGATITSVSCVARGRTSYASRGTSYFVLMTSGNTTVGTETSFTSTSTTTYTLSAGTWTVEQLNSGVRFRVGAKRASSNQAYSVRFYGASLTVNYSVSGTEYEVTSTLATENVDSIDPAGLTYVQEGSGYSLTINAASIDDVKVEDNGTDVTSSLVRHNAQPESFTFTGIPTTYDSANSVYDGTYEGSPEDGLAPHTSTDRICAYAITGSNAVSKLTYNFDCSSIPANATITSVTCIAKASCYSSGQYFNTKTLQLYNGNTAKGTATTITGNGSTGANHNISGGTWTRSELNDIKIVVYIARGTSNTSTQASFSFWGATLSIQYTIPVENPYYWTYSLSNVSADHTIILSDKIIEIPDEDPQYNYYPITISSINASTDPVRGTTRVVEGTNQTITIYPEDPLVTLITDNGVDVSSQLVQHSSGQITSGLTNRTSSYGFVYSSSTGYYTSNNKGVASSAAVSRITFNLPVPCLITFNFINYAEATYDFGIFGKVDTALGTTSATDSTDMCQLICDTNNYNSPNEQTLTYEVQSGEHFIDVKYKKDSYTDSYNDNLQFRITFEPLEPMNYYTYTLSNISSAHSLIFIFGDVSYYFVNSSGENCRLYPSGQFVCLPGDGYSLTIVPDDYSYSATVLDNGVDVTSAVTREEAQMTKSGETYTVVNYVYHLSNVQTGHTLQVSCQGPGIPLYTKVNNSWVQLTKGYQKTGGSWVEVSDVSTLFDTTKVYVHGDYDDQ